MTHEPPNEGAGAPSALLGAWEKAGGAPCSARYPDELELLAGGRYLGRKREGADEHPIWDVGSYEVVGEGRIAVSTSYDARPTYDYSLANDVLTFIDAEGCRFEYRRRP